MVPRVREPFYCERNGSGGVNNYVATSSFTFTGSIPSNFTKLVSSSSLVQTTGNNLNVGEVATYQVSVGAILAFQACPAYRD